jgi:hypothetical protein
MKPEIPPADTERASGIVRTLEETYRPLAANLPPELEPALVFSGDGESE